MFQKEVAKRIASGPGSKEYGILSVLLQAFYTIDYLFSVPPEAFYPRPKVNSGVIRLVRNDVVDLPCQTKFFKTVVKTAFNQRRKTLRNALKPLMANISSDSVPHMSRRAEQLTVAEFIEIALLLEPSK
jgi:16S rRNA (adenine1518-N6/adenine1519-N6)-dimethyltransferase